MRLISYCTPVKNRSREVIETLSFNLRSNRPKRDKIEFVVAIFDEDDRLVSELRSRFHDDIASGYLKVEQLPGLKYWHFGRAKNAFKTLMSGKLYSSLDGDNFVSHEETSQILDLYNEFGGNFIFHQFSGLWGDGTCGRITLGEEIYRAVGYDNSFLPRQFDELDLILSTIRKFPEVVYVTHLEESVFDLDENLAQFCRDESITIHKKLVADFRARMPLSRKGERYVGASDWLLPMQKFNTYASLLKNSASSSRKQKFCDEVRSAGSEFIDFAQTDDISRFFFGIERASLPMSSTGSLPVVACVRNDVEFLPEWYRHYKSIGAGPFFIVDEGSDIPVEETLPFDDVHVVRPVVGNFLTCKANWIKAMIACFIPRGSWVAIVDADEFIDFPSRWNSIDDFLEKIDAAGMPAAPGLLIDVVPNPCARGARRGIVEFDHHFLDTSPRDKSYSEDPSIRWAFGPYWMTSYKIDIRYRLFGTIDVLRKVPLVKNDGCLTLNQGFHDLGTHNRASLPKRLWASEFVLPIRHYKLMKLFDDDQRVNLLKQANTPLVYFARTTKNFGRMLNVNKDDLENELRRLKLVKYDPDFILDGKHHHPIWDSETFLIAAESLVCRIGFMCKLLQKKRASIAAPN